MAQRTRSRARQANPPPAHAPPAEPTELKWAYVIEEAEHVERYYGDETATSELLPEPSTAGLHSTLASPSADSLHAKATPPLRRSTWTSEQEDTPPRRAGMPSGSSSSSASSLWRKVSRLLRGDDKPAQVRPCRCPVLMAEPDTATDFIFAPITLERLIITGSLLCLDSFLYVLTILPIRGVIAAVLLVTTALTNLFQQLAALTCCRRRGRGRVRWHRVHPIQRVDLVRFLLLVLASLVIQHFRIDYFVWFIRKSLSKLRMMVTFVEIIDRVFISFGISILGALSWRVVKPRSQHLQLGGLFLSGIVYLVVHATFLFFHLSIFEVSASLGSNSLLSLLVLIQFAEMKANVLKKQSLDKLTSIVYSDIVERFQTAFLLILLFLYKWLNNEVATLDAALPVLKSLSVILLSEVLTDWIKHMSICNYSGLSPHEYTNMGSKFLKALARTSSSSLLTDRSFAVSREIGAFPGPLAVLLIRIVVCDWLPKFRGQAHLAFFVLCACFLVLFVAKWCTHLGLERLAKLHRVYRRIQKVPSLKRSTSTFYKVLLIKPPNYKHEMEEHRRSIDLTR